MNNIQGIPVPQLTVYKASAGCGKTFTLAAHYIALLMDGESFRNILAVTFTNKATKEMKDRILKYLQDIQNWNPKEEGFFDKMQGFMTKKAMAQKAIQQRAETVLYEILNDYDNFTVCTIDRYLQMLLGGAARTLNLQANYNVELDTKNIIDKAIDKLMSSVSAQNKQVLEGIREIVTENMDNGKNWDIRRKLKELAKEIQKEAFLKNEDEVNAEVSLIPDYKKQLEKNWQAAIAPIKTSIKNYHAKLENYDWLEKSFMRDNIASIEGRADVYKRNFFNDLAGKHITRLQKGYKDWKTATQKTVPASDNDCKDYYSLLSYLVKHHDELKVARNNYLLSKENLGGLALLQYIAAEMDKIAAANNSILLAKTPVKLSTALGKGDAQFILERTGTRFRHIMIDEFQDTSKLQWEIFKSIIQEIIAAGGNSALVVGDVKQSIYRWRNGDWTIMQNIDGDFPQQCQSLPLIRNFRSRKEIVKFNLEFFEKLSKESSYGLDEADKGIYNEDYSLKKLQDFYQKGKDGGHVSVRLFPAKSGKANPPKEPVIPNMLETIQKLVKAGQKPENITILVRFNKEAMAIADFLNKNREDYPKMELTSSESFKLENSVSVQILVNALRYLADRKDKIALAYVAMHYQQDILKNPLPWNKILNPDKQDKGFISHPEKMVPQLEQEYDSLQQLPLYEKVERLATILLTKDGTAVLQDDAYLFYFFDLMLEFLNGNVSDEKAFLQEWDEDLSQKTVAAGAGNGVQLMTIHKAKGLEAETIFIPFCDWSLYNDKDLLWLKPNPEFSGMELIPVSKIRMGDSIYKEEYAEEHHKEVIDNLNMLYVAFTRAKNNLFIMGNVKIDKDSNPSIKDSCMEILLNNLRDFDGTKWEEKVDAEDGQNTGFFEEIYGSEEPFIEDHPETTETNSGDNKQKFGNYSGEMHFMPSAEAVKYISSLDAEAKESPQHFIERGNLMHEIYSAIQTTDDIDRAVADKQNEGLIESAERAAEIKKSITESFQNEQAANWFDGSWKLFRECTILEHDEKDGTGILAHIRPDRVMTKGGQTIVVDYKFGKPNAEYRKQVGKYMTALQRMGYKGVRGFLWYVTEGNRIEEVTKE